MLKSKRMLQVAKTALRMLSDVTDNDQVEVLWIAAITSLRAVGHVLAKTDKIEHPEMSSSIDQWWKNINRDKENNKIFFEFIEKERNSTIKQFKIEYDKNYKNILVLEGNGIAKFINEITDENIYIPMVEGVYETEDIRDLLSMAIDWWEDQFLLLGI